MFGLHRPVRDVSSSTRWPPGTAFPSVDRDPGDHSRRYTRRGHHRGNGGRERPGQPHVASADAKVSGLRFDQSLATFWRVGLAEPTHQNSIVGIGILCPVVHGVLIHYGTSGKIWTIPAGTPVLLVSVIAPECSSNEPADVGAGPSGAASVLACARRIRGIFLDEVLTLDGHPVRRLSGHFIETQRINVTPPKPTPLTAPPGQDNRFDGASGPGCSASVGTTVIFENPTPGQHPPWGSINVSTRARSSAPQRRTPIRFPPWRGPSTVARDRSYRLGERTCASAPVCGLYVRPLRSRPRGTELTISSPRGPGAAKLSGLADEWAGPSNGGNAW